MAKNVETSALELACYEVARLIEEIAHKQCDEHNIHGVAYLANKASQVGMLGQQIRRRFGQ